MRARQGAATVIAAIALLCFPAAASAHASPHACAKLRISGLRVSRITTTLVCNSAHSVLRRLLRDGLESLPRPRRHSRGWGCRSSGAADRWSCRRAPRRGVKRRISFRVRTIEAPPPPAPAPAPVDPVAACVKRWNSDPAIASVLGYHLYLDHGVRRAWVYPFQGTRCAVIGVVPATDPEYGADGAVSRPSTNGWDYMNAVPELGEPVVVQGQAPGNANATLLPTGGLTLP